MRVIDLPYDLYDPPSVAARFADVAGCMLLESAARGGYGRYTVLAADPFLVLTGKGDSFAVVRDGRVEQRADEPWALMESLWRRYQLDPIPEIAPLPGGLIGYWGYELGRHVERVPAPRYDDLAMPDLWLGAYDRVIVWDHPARTCRLISTGLPAAGHHERQLVADRRARELASAISERGHVPPHVPTNQVGHTQPAVSVPTWPLKAWPGVASTFTRAHYERVVQRAIEYIYAGDIYQVNLSQRFETELRCHPWRLYAALRRRNPADFAAYLHCGDAVIASASPERFVSVVDGRVETRPIKGTVPRSEDPDEDRRRAAALLSSPKDRAENLMIVDLLRNDLGRVCTVGSVDVPELWTLEAHPTVYHLVSTVTGRVRPELSPIDVLRACFPGGSITGAPKIRAMEIISELEPTARGAYCGAIGYLGWDGRLDTNITIRSFIMRGGRVTWQAGGGIVADSTPAGEYDETLAKARALSEVAVQPC